MLEITGMLDREGTAKEDGILRTRTNLLEPVSEWQGWWMEESMRSLQPTLHNTQVNR
jgi:hypothetical protein